MSDLISRSELINALKVHFDSCFSEDGELLYSDHICTSDDVVDLIKLVENQPTAYDVEKVVAELEKLKQRNKELSKGAYLEDDKSFYFWAYTNFARAIGIVRKGGVEWTNRKQKSRYKIKK